MPDSRQIKKPKKNISKKPENQQEKLSRKKQEKLKKLDSYIENVLEEAGEDFLDQFKQIEGE